MSLNAEKLYNLLPAIYRLRDTEQGESLKALLTAIAEQIAVLEEDLAQLYDDQFIETCADWVIPYIGDLIGYRTLHSVAPKISSPRAEVANTIGYRRRKGTAAIIEQIAQDVTGWNTNVVEFFQSLATTQYLNHLRFKNYVTPDLRQWKPLELWNKSAVDSLNNTTGLNSPFDSLAHLADVRRIAINRGRHNIPNIGIFIWRLQSYFVTHSTARNRDNLYYTFNPFSLDTPLFNRPQPETEITHLASEINVPKPLCRRELYEELEARRQALVDGVTPLDIYFGDEYPVFQIFLDGDSNPIPPEEVLICDLTELQHPPTSKPYQPKPTKNNPNPQQQQLPIQVAVDPVLGRLVFPKGNEPQKVEVSYAYGFSTDMGSGPYDRSESVIQTLLKFREINWQIGVTQNAPDNNPKLVKTLAEAIEIWNQQPAGIVGVICIMDSRTYRDDLNIQFPASSQLLIVASQSELADSSISELPILGQLYPKDLRPHIQANIFIINDDSNDDTNNSELGELVFNGLLIQGLFVVNSSNLGSLEIVHCTLLSEDHTGLHIPSSSPQLIVSIQHSICDYIHFPEAAEVFVKELVIQNSTVGLNIYYSNAIDASLTDLKIEKTTILGKCLVNSIEASNSIFSSQVIVKKPQKGCVRFSYLPLDSQVPRRYRCLPENGDSLTRLQFTSISLGHPAYCQLSNRCSTNIRQGADDESEMGVFHDLYQPQRETNLRVRLDEYLRFSLEAGIFYAT
ncbi:hypothetical protein H6G93_35190 [Nostoc sp. FACHB-973]|nr:hypothetical protein [Nostoc sp. FACHB-973]